MPARAILTATGSHIPSVRVPNEHFLNHEFHTPEGRPIDKPAADTITGFTVLGEKPAVELAIAKLEKRLTWCKDWMGQLYGHMIKVRTGALTWSASAFEDVMTEAAKLQLGLL